jgi:hypothetical protein
MPFIWMKDLRVPAPPVQHPEKAVFIRLDIFGSMG